MFPRHGEWRAALVAAVCALSRPATANDQACVDHAVEAIKTLNAEFYNVNTGIWNNAWWNSANALTTLANFASLRTDEANKLNIGGYIRNTFTQAQKTNVQTVKAMDKNGMVWSTYCLDNSNGCIGKREFLQKRGFDHFINEFYDDEGWWALALIGSHDVTGDKDYLDAAVNIFNDMQTGRNTPCGGGIFWNKQRKYVNAITSELYLSVAASLANRIPQNKKTYLDEAKAHWEWFEKSGMINAQNLINDGLDDHCKNNGQPTWSYNQGVVLGGLAELSRATGDGRYIERAVGIAQAAIKALANPDGILVEVDKCELRGDNCGGDGAQFKGVFMRNLGYLNAVAPHKEFADFIIKNADSIWAKDRDGGKLGVAWTGPYIKATGASQSSALDVLVAAISVKT
ncbi:Putative mannan endo-1,6-alpha-mannosidase [Tolypocladium paradoxum]|uniref:Mannan endo-1,6-alpha-mannosidase n=1 Tax=Tolypocladium paradoxum TaxID=94208 RepID=A0A2S4KNZ3_9HYPO|nr:Putative mannan endo-1,6-alpha-mannosidase [Tolypocladium paradoxum]